MFDTQHKLRITSIRNETKLATAATFTERSKLKQNFYFIHERQTISANLCFSKSAA